MRYGSNIHKIVFGSGSSSKSVHELAERAETVATALRDLSPAEASLVLRTALEVVGSHRDEPDPGPELLEV